MESCRAEQDIRAALQSAVTCAILAPAGAHRSRMLSMLYKDERVTDAQAVPQFPFMEKMLMERLIAPCAPPPQLASEALFMIYWSCPRRYGRVRHTLQAMCLVLRF